MKKIYYLLFVALFATATTRAQQGWVKQSLDLKIAVNFPKAPTKTIANGIDIYTSKGPDSLGYIANMVDLKVVANLDSATLAPLKDTQEFADQLKTGMSSSMPAVTLGDVTLGKWKDFTTYSIIGTNDAKKQKMYMYMMIIGSKIYSLSCVVPDGKASTNKDTFFSSLSLN